MNDWNVPCDTTDYSSVLRRCFSLFELLEKDKLPECAREIARMRVVSELTLRDHEAGVNRPKVLDPFFGVVHG